MKPLKTILVISSIYTISLGCRNIECEPCSDPFSVSLELKLENYSETELEKVLVIKKDKTTNNSLDTLIYSSKKDSNLQIDRKSILFNDYDLYKNEQTDSCFINLELIISPTERHSISNISSEFIPEKGKGKCSCFGTTNLKTLQLNDSSVTIKNHQLIF